MFAATALILMLNSAAPASDDAARAKAAFQAAQKLYKQARYPEAIEKFEEAYRLKPHPSIFFNVGRCYEQLSEIPKALRSYREYLKAAPDAKDKESVTDAIINLERRLKEQGVQQLLLYTEPSGALVSVDGTKHGASPMAVELKPGNHKVEVSLDGYESVERSIVMPNSHSLELSVALKVAKPAAPVAATAEPKPEPRKDPGAERPMPPPLVSAAAAEPEGGLRSKAWIPAAAGGALLVGGGVFYGLSLSNKSALLSNDPKLADPSYRASLASSGTMDQTVGFVLAGVGGAAVATAATMFFWPSKPEAPTVSVFAGPRLGGAVISGEF